MFRKMICLVSLVLVLGLVGDVRAQDWTDTSGDHLWGTPTNWDGDAVPTSSSSVYIDSIPGPTIGTGVAVVLDGGMVGLDNPGALIMDGGTLAANWFNLGENDAGTGTLNMNSGSITIAWDLGVGAYGEGLVNMTGGTIEAGYFLVGAWGENAVGHVDLHGGTITAEYLLMRDGEGAVGTMDVRAGTLITNNDQFWTIQEYIDNGWITSYDGQGTLNLDYDVTNEGKTTLTATPLLEPNPSDGGLVADGAVELSWTLPDPCVPGQPVAVDVYFTDDYEALKSFSDPEAIQVVSEQNVTSFVVQTQPKTRYYWAVDTYIGDPNDPIWGPIFSFVADNLPPKVDVGADVVTWLEEGTRSGNLDATVVEKHTYTVQWTVVSEPDDPNSPDAVIADPTAEDTTVTLSAAGEYVLQVVADDGEYTDSDTVTISVYNNGCEAAQSLPDYQPLVGDLNGDCKVDDADLALLNENFLNDNSFTDGSF